MAYIYIIIKMKSNKLEDDLNLDLNAIISPRDKLLDQLVMSYGGNASTVAESKVPGKRHPRSRQSHHHKT